MSVGAEIVSRELTRLNEQSRAAALSLDDTRRLVLLLKLEEPEAEADEDSPFSGLSEELLNEVLKAKAQKPHE